MQITCSSSRVKTLNWSQESWKNNYEGDFFQLTHSHPEQHLCWQMLSSSLKNSCQRDFYSWLSGLIGPKIKKNLFDSCFLKKLKTFVNKYCSELSGPLRCYKIWKSFKTSISFKLTSFHRKSVISRYSIKHTEFKINLFSGLLTVSQCLFSWLWTSNCLMGSKQNYDEIYNKISKHANSCKSCNSHYHKTISDRLFS